MKLVTTRDLRSSGSHGGDEASLARGEKCDPDPCGVPLSVSCRRLTPYSCRSESSRS